MEDGTIPEEASGKLTVCQKAPSYVSEASDAVHMGLVL